MIEHNFSLMYSNYISALREPCVFCKCKYLSIALQNRWEGEVFIVDVIYLYIYPTDALLF